MLNKDIHPQLKGSKTDLTLRFIILVCIATMAFLISGCVTLPSSTGSADPSFFNAGLVGSDYISVILPDLARNRMIVAGKFSSINGQPANNIAIYDPTQDRWLIPPVGVRHSDGGTYISALAISGRYLFAGGRFTETTDGSTTGLGSIARFDLETSQWSPLADGGLSNGINEGTVSALEVIGNTLYAGGLFTKPRLQNSNPVISNFIIRYDIATNVWSALPLQGLNGEVDSIEAFAGDLFVGGKFHDTTGASPFILERIARYDPDTDSWLSLPGGGVNNDVNTIVASSLGVYVGGTFTDSADGAQPLNKIAFFAANTWSALPDNGLDNTPYSLAVVGDDLYVGGAFTSTGNGAPLNYIARLNNNTWSSLEGNGLDGSVSNLSVLAGNLYITGQFSQTADDPVTVTGLDGLARYGLAASPLAEGLGTGTIGFIPFNGGNGLNGEVRAIESGPDGMLYVGGNFTRSFDGTVGLGNVARFDPAIKKWTALAMGGLNGQVNAIAVHGNTLYVGGGFTSTAQLGGPVLNRIARYDLTTNTWSAMPNDGLNDHVRSMKIIGDNLYVGGNFVRTVNPVVNNLNLISRFNLTTSAWQPVGNNGLSYGVVEALGAHGTDLIVGGYFTGTADAAVTDIYYIARYDTTIPGPNPSPWSPMANGGLNFMSNVFAIDGDQMMVRGGFFQTRDGSITLNGLGLYDFSTTPNTWSPVIGDPDSRALLMQTNASKRVGNDMYIGGTFTSVGGRVALYFTRIYLQQWGGLAPLAISTDWFAGANWTTGSPPPANTSVVIPAGTGPIDISSGDVILQDLVLNGGTISVGAGRTLTINGTLALSGGKIDGLGSVVVTSCKPEAVMFGDNASYVETALTRCVNDLGAYNFDVGTANAYSPVTIKNVTGTGNVSVKPNQGAYSAPAMTLPATRLARWWTIENPGGGITNADIFFNYPQADIAGNEYGYRAYRIAGGNASVMPGSINWFSNIATAPNVTGFSDWTLAEFAPSAATVSLAGRVTTANGAGISKAIVTLTDQNGNVRRILTGSFGYYRFDDVAAGQTCVLSVGNKRHLFAEPTRVVTISDDALEIDFVALP